MRKASKRMRECGRAFAVTAVLVTSSLCCSDKPAQHARPAPGSSAGDSSNLPDQVSGRRPEIAVELFPYPKDKSIYNRSPVMVRFTNNSERPVRILKPLDGSLWCWHMPYYKLAVEDGSGNELSLRGRCGNSGLWADREGPDDYIVELKSGGTYEQEIGLHHMVRTPGTHTVTFSYIYDASKAGLRGITYPKGLWEGEARSAATQLELKASL
jgi:hypothetical protein